MFITFSKAILRLGLFWGAALLGNLNALSQLYSRVLSPILQNKYCCPRPSSNPFCLLSPVALIPAGSAPTRIQGRGKAQSPGSIAPVSYLLGHPRPPCPGPDPASRPSPSSSPGLPWLHAEGSTSTVRTPPLPPAFALPRAPRPPRRRPARSVQGGA